ncbi:hypothetical protein EMIHUDRAFT_223892 [Emiliania huxleyi CCMP1516]|uniref:Transmembrane protein n=2 Tax=Emiliania huxleyi TaxID=2903 RepID=A0A0D3KTE8_EMIH1|nr:hypothetical protein EMIHUDRAFT_223892 [Emiliania huxleyi CCMP1516]EOD39033.1 hypothetical protein EMIHUDRAFT_223892 [Emiliania huxleyi CCMP1516]|eukprot:XP_005791462.1 hypothetical protein EMIHUDRAFT_223892 [Emiliania huxleyi CCMP1516]
MQGWRRDSSEKRPTVLGVSCSDREIYLGLAASAAVAMYVTCNHADFRPAVASVSLLLAFAVVAGLVMGLPITSGTLARILELCVVTSGCILLAIRIFSQLRRLMLPNEPAGLPQYMSPRTRPASPRAAAARAPADSASLKALMTDLLREPTLRLSALGESRDTDSPRAPAWASGSASRLGGLELMFM